MAIDTNWIEFPGLGLKFEHVNPVVEIGGFQIYWYGILISIGFLAAIILALKACRSMGLSQDDLITYILVATPAAIVGARLYFVIFKWDQYKNNLLEIFNTRNGGLAIYGGIIGAVIAVAILAKIKKHNMLRLLDLAMPYIALGQAVGRWGNFVNQEAYGRVTNLPWRMTGGRIPEGAVHPSFFYESVLCFAIFGFLLFYRKRFKKYHGEVLFLYMILYGTGRSVIEYIRGDDALLIGSTSIRVSLVISLVLVVAAVVSLIFIKKIPAAQIDKEKLALEIREAYIKDTGKDPDTGLPVEGYKKSGSKKLNDKDKDNNENDDDDKYVVFGSDFEDDDDSEEDTDADADSEETENKVSVESETGADADSDDANDTDDTNDKGLN